MTMTSVAVAPGSLGAPPAMLTPKRYHLQPGLSTQQTSASPTPGKNYDTLSKGKKSWSVRLGLSRQNQSTDDTTKGWGTISGGSALSRQMLYGDPWLYGTVRSSRGIHDRRGFVTAQPPPGAPVLIVCSCPEFLTGTTRKLGNCRKCGGHRLAGVPLGGTCRIAPTSSRSRPSLAGVLRSSVDDPYDLMRRSRLIEPRSRARSISPHRQSNQRDSRSQSVARSNKERKGSADAAVSRSEWFDTETPGYDSKDNSRKSRPGFGGTSTDDWLDENTSEEGINAPGRVVRVAKKARNWQEGNSSNRIVISTDNSRRKPDEEWKDGSKVNSSGNTATDSRKSILECDVNPYLLVKKQMRDEEDDLSDDLSDNALELEETASSSLFDPSKVKSIERVPNRNAVAAIGGQRIRVFNERREISDEDETVAAAVTRIPIPKISPKRPPRRVKESRTTFKSILKRGKADGKRKNVLFNVNNVIFAPEKPAEIIMTGRRTSRSSINNSIINAKDNTNESIEEPIVPEEPIPERPKFITIPNIRDPKRIERTIRIQEPKIIPEMKANTGIEKLKIDQLAALSKRPEVPARNSSNKNSVKDSKNTDTTKDQTKSSSESNRTEFSNEFAKTSGKNDLKSIAIDENTDSKIKVSSSETSLETIRPEDETELEIEIEELVDHLPDIEIEEKELILMSGGDNYRRPGLSRSQSDRTTARPEVSAGAVHYLDTMRLSLRRRSKDSTIDDNETNCLDILATDDIVENIDTVTENKVKPIQVPVEEKPKVAEIEDISMDSPPRITELVEKEAEPPPQRRVENSRNHENFRRMRPTSWSPPPGKSKHLNRDRASDPGPFDLQENVITQTRMAQPTRRSSQEAPGSPNNSRNSPSSSVGSSSSSRIEIVTAKPENNVCKITVSPRSSPLVHRLQVGGNDAPRGARRTSILINGDPSPGTESNVNDNKVTISVGGEDSVCNPTVISVNTASPPKIQSSSENRTLVILENYKSNIVLESSTRDEKPTSLFVKDTSKEEERVSRKNDDSVGSPMIEERSSEFFGDRSGVHRDKRRSCQDSSSCKLTTTGLNEDDRSSFGKVEQKSRLRDLEGSSRWSTLSKEALISKLLEDSLRKARENGEILDESSGEAILRILKQSLLKSKEYESSESTIEPEASYSTSPSLNSDTDFMSTNLFLEENPYEVIKEPIYEEIPDEPPPLPLSPPPTEDYIKDRLYFAEEYKEAYYKKVNAGKFLRSYLSEDTYKKGNNDFKIDDANTDTYLSKSPEDFFKKVTIPTDGNLTSKFELLNYLMDSKDRSATVEEDEVEEDDEEDEEDTEGDLEALYEQKEASMGDLSSKSSQISNVSDSSEECNIILTSSPETLKTRTVDIERTDSGVGSESSQASSSRGIARRWRTGNASLGPGRLLGEIPQVISGDTKLCEDCEQRLEPLITDSGVVYAPFVCRKCSKKRAERKEIITEIVETEQKYGRDLQIILEEFHRPMLRAGLLTQEQLAAIFLNVEELLEHNLVLAEKLKDAVEFSQVSGDEDLVTVDAGKIFLESERMLHAFESYCTRQGSASLLLQNLEKEKELLRIFLKVSQMENTVLRRMNLNSFLMVPVQRVTKYPLLLARLLKATPALRSDVQEARKRLEQAQANIELHLEHMNAEAKDVTSTKLWRRISIIQNGRRSNGEQDMVNIKLRKMAVEVLEWAHEEARFVLEGRLLVAQPTDNNWRRGRTVKLAPVTAMLVTNGKPSTEFLDSNDDSLFPRQIGIKEATLLLVKEKIGRYSLLREPLYLDKCIVCCETDLEDYFEIQELSSKETFIFKAEDGARTKRWCRTLQAHAQSLGAWRRRRGALPNIMICGVARS